MNWVGRLTRNNPEEALTFFTDLFRSVLLKREKEMVTTKNKQFFVSLESLEKSVKGLDARRGQRRELNSFFKKFFSLTNNSKMYRLV